MDHSHHNHHEAHNDGGRKESDNRLAAKATLHCLMGCGLGEVGGVIIGVALGLNFFVSLAIGVSLGFVFGYLLGILPLVRSGFNLAEATKITVSTETLSIVVMETAEVLTEIYFPGMMHAGLSDAVFWAGLGTALVMGFAAAYPVNLALVKRGIRHAH